VLLFVSARRAPRKRKCQSEGDARIYSTTGGLSQPGLLLARSGASSIRRLKQWEQIKGQYFCSILEKKESLERQAASAYLQGTETTRRGDFNSGPKRGLVFHGIDLPTSFGASRGKRNLKTNSSFNETGW